MRIALVTVREPSNEAREPSNEANESGWAARAREDGR
jgi:hypothetical protein